MRCLGMKHFTKKSQIFDTIPLNDNFIRGDNVDTLVQKDSSANFVTKFLLDPTNQVVGNPSFPMIQFYQGHHQV